MNQNSISDINLKRIAEYYFHFSCNAEMQTIWFLKPNYRFKSPILNMIHYASINDKFARSNTVKSLLNFELLLDSIPFSSIESEDCYFAIDKNSLKELSSILSLIPSMIPARTPSEIEAFLFEVDLLKKWIKKSLDGHTLAYRYIG